VIAQSSATIARRDEDKTREIPRPPSETAHSSDWHADCIQQAEEKIMSASILNYPGFQNLPKGARQMLLISEAHFFEQSASHHAEEKAAAQARRTQRSLKLLLTSLFIALGHRIGA
jgi:hypothetical protein